MPFDSTTFAPAKADPLDLDAMIAWLETMPAEGEYNYVSWRRCVIAGFLIAQGYSRPCVGETRLWLDIHDDLGRKIPVGWDRAVRTVPHTYGAALSRFRALREGK